jgi:hypothetical protein
LWTQGSQKVRKNPGRSKKVKEARMDNGGGQMALTGLGRSTAYRLISRSWFRKVSKKVGTTWRRMSEGNTRGR